MKNIFHDEKFGLIFLYAMEFCVQKSLYCELIGAIVKHTDEDGDQK